MVEVYEWDEAKRIWNLAKHEVNFTAVENFEWATAFVAPSHRHGETRFAATGYIGNRLYAVIFTVRVMLNALIACERQAEGR